MTIESDMDEGAVTTEETTDTETEETADTQEKAPEAEKPKETPEARVARLRRQLEREEKKLGLSDEKPAHSQEKETRSGDLDYGEKAFLRSYDIKGSDELALVKDWQKRTGDSLDTVVEDDIFQAKLSKLREARATVEAVPKGTRRTNAPATDDVSFWNAKIDAGTASLHDITDVNTRRKVLNARIDKEKVGSRFSDNPIQIT